MLYYERKLKKQGVTTVIGIDEAGRGPLAGPVVAAAVMLMPVRYLCRIDDSKKLSPKLRRAAFLEIIAQSPFGIGIIGQETIDRVNILVATVAAMEQALGLLEQKLKITPPSLTGTGLNFYKRHNVHILVDGTMKLDITWPYTSIIGGDAKSKSIAAASIIAKVVRDDIMYWYDRFYPEFGFCKHKGYPTEEHRKRVREIGLSPIHRRSFCTGLK